MKQFIDKVLGYSGKPESGESVTLIPQNQDSRCTVTHCNLDASSVETCGAVHTSAGSCTGSANITHTEAGSEKISSLLSKVDVIASAVSSVFSSTMPGKYGEDNDGVGHSTVDHDPWKHANTIKKFALLQVCCR